MIDKNLNYKKNNETKLEEKIHELNAKGKIRAAIKACQRYFEINKKNPYIYRLAGKLKFKIGDMKGGIENLKKAISLKPDFPDAHYNLGICYFRQIHFTRAIDSLNKCLELDPDFNMAYYWLGLAYFHKGDTFKSIDSYKKILKKNPSSIMAHYHLGTIYNSIEEYEKAIPHFKKVSGHDEDEAVLYHIGVAYFKTGKFSESLKMFRKALELNPEDKRSENMLKLVFNVPGYG